MRVISGHRSRSGARHRNHSGTDSNGYSWACDWFALLGAKNCPSGATQSLAQKTRVYPMRVVGKTSRATGTTRPLPARHSAIPLGQISLPITLGTQETFQTENISFEVADFKAAYHAILGRPA